ncbi:MAG TPA: YbjN domain-containing protein [Candidatus Avimuribaculum pullicola]|nr:YbjN domain-containing protein [Candidatus Avimuribaculum pullicola]
MTKKEMVISVLEELGFKPKEDEDGDLMVRYQLKNVYAMMGDADEHYVVFILPQFYEVDEGDEALAITACNKVTRELKMGKVYIDSTYKSATASCEFYFTDEESLKQNIEHSFNIMGIIRTVFRNAFDELKAASA